MIPNYIYLPIRFSNVSQNLHLRTAIPRKKIDTSSENVLKIFVSGVDFHQAVPQFNLIIFHLLTFPCFSIPHTPSLRLDEKRKRSFPRFSFLISN
jgi:hypothetical protein